MPGARRKGRENCKSSDEYDAETEISTIAFYHASKDPFRMVAGLSYAIPWPLHHQNPYVYSLSPSRKIIDLIRPTYEAILTQHEIQHYSGAETVTSLAPFHSEKYIDTLIISTNDHPSPAWQLAVDEIQALIDSTIQNHRQVERVGSTSHPEIETETQNPIRVELRNPKFMFKNISFPVSPGSPAHFALLRTEEIVMHKAEGLCAGDLSSITWVMRGPSCGQEELRNPTGLVKIRIRVRGKWRDIEEKLQKCVDDVLEGDVDLGVDLPWDVNVELVPGFLSSDVASGDCEGIGVRGSQKAVSIGPWVTFEDQNGGISKGFLTANLEDGSTDSRDADEKDEDDDGNNPQGPVKSDLGDIFIDYPAPIDVEWSTKIFQRDTDGDYQVTKNQINISTISNLVEAGGLGTVLHSSRNYRKNEKEHRMDWSFVRLNDLKNFGSNITAPQLAINTGLLMNGKIHYDFPNEQISTIASPPAPGSWMLKYGRTSEYTARVVNPIPGACYWKVHNNNGERLKTREIHVLNCNENTGPMMRPGDEGCMFYNEKKEWMGIGMAVDGFDGSAFVTSAEEVVRDVEERTGGRIRLD